MSNALTQLPRLLAWLDKHNDIGHCFVVEFIHRQTGCSTWSVYATTDGDLDITDEHAYEVCDEICQCDHGDDARTLATLRNMLPALAEMAQDWATMADPDCGVIIDADAAAIQLSRRTALAQRILDAAKAVLTPEQYEEATRGEK